MRLRCKARSFSYTPLHRVSVALNAANTFATSAELKAPNQFEYSPLQDCASRSVFRFPPERAVVAVLLVTWELMPLTNCFSTVVQVHGNWPGLRCERKTAYTFLSSE